jgi:hypothetical protein
MKKLILSLSIVAAGFTGFAATASAQRYQEPVIEARVEGPRISIGRGYERDERGYVGRGYDRDDRGYEHDEHGSQRGSGRGRAAAARDLNRLNYEVRLVRDEIRAAGGGGPRVRAMYRDVLRGTDRLNANFERQSRPPWEIRRRADELRGQLNFIRRELRYRDIRRGDDWR